LAAELKKIFVYKVPAFRQEFSSPYPKGLDPLVKTFLFNRGCHSESAYE